MFPEKTNFKFKRNRAATARDRRYRRDEMSQEKWFRGVIARRRTMIQMGRGKIVGSNPEINHQETMSGIGTPRMIGIRKRIIGKITRTKTNGREVHSKHPCRATGPGAACPGGLMKSPNSTAARSARPRHAWSFPEPLSAPRLKVLKS
jgi:hypothetical protein